MPSEPTEPPPADADDVGDDVPHEDGLRDDAPQDDAPDDDAPDDEGPQDHGDDRAPIGWTTVASFTEPTVAHVARLHLEDEDIPCFIADENIGTAIWH